MSDSTPESAGATGYFRVVNVSTSVISGYVTHDNKERVEFPSLNPGDATKYAAFSPATFTDSWIYYFKSGVGVYRGKKDCNFSSSSDNTIDIILSGGYITIVPSRTSPCYSGLDSASTQEGAEPEAAEAPS